MAGRQLNDAFEKTIDVDKSPLLRQTTKADIEEEEVIEEEINNSEHKASPASPLVNTRTKAKSKMPLKMMKPPKPVIKQHSPVFQMEKSEHNESIKEELPKEEELMDDIFPLGKQKSTNVNLNRRPFSPPVKQNREYSVEPKAKQEPEIIEQDDAPPVKHPKEERSKSLVS
jgi:hypothetical protein